MQKTCRKLGIRPGETTPDGQVHRQALRVSRGVRRGARGAGERRVARAGHRSATSTGSWRARRSRGSSTGPEARASTSSSRTSGPTARRCLDAYRKVGGYQNLKKHLETAPEKIIDEVKKSSLRGRGGAGFPTGMKWGFLPNDGRPRYLCVNADESEPGTYKDRVIIENDPHRLIEATVISAHAIRAKAAYIYIRGEFHEGARTLEKALAEARGAGYVGQEHPRHRHRRRGVTSTAAPEPTSAARRRLSSRASRASAASRGSSPPSRPTSASTAAPPSSTTSRRCAACPSFSTGGGMVRLRTVSRRTVVPSSTR